MVDDARQELVVGLESTPTILTFDLNTGELLSEVEPTTSAPLVQHGLGVSPDGELIAVSSNQIGRLNRRSGETTAVASVRDVVFVRVRPDGTILTGTLDEETSIYDLDSNALVQRAWPIEPFSRVEIHQGVAAVVAGQTGDLETIDLDTGERTVLRTLEVDGESAVAVAGYPVGENLFVLDGWLGLSQWTGEHSRPVTDDGPLVPGTMVGDLWTGASIADVGYQTAVLVDLGADQPRQILQVPASMFQAVLPTAAGGIYVLDRRGQLRTFDGTGARTGLLEIDQADVTSQQLPVNLNGGGLMALNPRTGTLAITGAKGEVLLVDPVSGSIDELPGVDTVTSFGFVRNGDWLAVIESDGAVVLWDVEHTEPIGLVWRGNGSGSSGTVIWSDEASASMWVAIANKIIEIPTNPDRWIERACEVVGRDFTQAEWDRLVPGSEPLVTACR